MTQEELTPREWLKHYKNKLDSSNETYRPNGFKIIGKQLKAIEIISKKGLNTNELFMIKKNMSWVDYVDLFCELYYGDEDMTKNLKTKREWAILKGAFYDNRRKN